MQHLWSDLRLAARALTRRRGFTAVAVGTMALGIGGTTAMFSLVHGILLRPLPYPEADRLVSVWQTRGTNPQRPQGVSWGSVSTLNFADWRRQATSFESMALYGGTGFMVTGPGEPEIVDGGSVTPGFFRVFGAQPVLGREFTEEENRFQGPRVLVISHGLWKERFGGRPDVLGQTMEISGRTWEVVGVAPPRFDFPGGARLWAPVQGDESSCGRACVYLDAVARLKPGATVAAAGQEMAVVARRLEQAYPNDNADTTAMVAPLQDIMVGSVRNAVIALFGAVAMVLLIACANVANLLLARGAAREAEMALRASLGATRGRLVAELLAESVVIACAGALAGLLLARTAVDAVKAAAADQVPRLEAVAIDAPVVAFAMALAGATALLFGLGPALSLARLPLATTLHGLGRGDTGDRRRGLQRAALLAAEVALSVVLLSGAFLLLRSFVRLQSVEPGWDGAGVTVFSVYLPPARYADMTAVQAGFAHLDERLSGLPGVEVVGRISGPPIAGGVNVQSFRRTDAPPPPPADVPVALYRIIDDDYFKAMRIPVRRGRGVEAVDRADAPPVVVISEAMARRFWPGEDPLGRAIQIDNGDAGPRTIVGIVGDVRSTELTSAPAPEMYVPHGQTERRVMTFMVRGALPPATVLASARDVLRAFDSRLPLIHPRSMAAIEREALARPRLLLLLVALFAGLAVVLAAVGVYGVVAYLVARRTREIGVRMALGARAAQVARLVLWQGMRPALAGLAVGLAGAAAGARLIAGLLYEVPPRDPLTLAAVVPLLLAVVALACLLPALRASRIAPVEALRAD